MGIFLYEIRSIFFYFMLPRSTKIPLQIHKYR